MQDYSYAELDNTGGKPGRTQCGNVTNTFVCLN